MSLSISINDVAIPLPEGIAVSLTFRNPLFTDKRISEAFSYSFSLPASPTLNKILKNSRRVDAKTRAFILPAKMNFGAINITGSIRIAKTSNELYSCNITSDGRDIFDITNERHVSDFDYGNIELWTEEEENLISAAEKSLRWSTLVGKENDKSPDEGAFKFPMLKAYYESPSNEEASMANDAFNYTFWKGGNVNMAFWNPAIPSTQGFGFQNYSVPNNKFQNTTNWTGTFSPCLRVDHMLKSILNDLDVFLEKNEIENIQEFSRLTNFSCYVADKVQVVGLNHWNVFGGRYELSDFTPDTNAWTVFDTLIELFSVVFVIGDNNALSILLSKNILEKDAIDMTAKTNPETIININNDQKPINLFYDIEDEGYKIINDLMYQGYTVENKTKWMYKPIGELNGDGMAIKHMPLRTLLGKPRYYFENFLFYATYQDDDWQCSGQFDSYLLSFAFMKPKASYSNDGNYLDDGDQLMLSSNEYKENDKPTRFFLSLFHGRAISRAKATIQNPDFTCEIDNPGTAPFNIGIYLTLNLDKTDTLDFTEGIDPYFPKISVSEKHLYLNEVNSTESKGTNINYHQPLSDFMEKTEEIQKTLYLQAHEINEMSKFLNPKHRIDSPEGAFEGIVKEFKVTLKSNSISSTQVTYLKQRYE